VNKKPATANIANVAISSGFEVLRVESKNLVVNFFSPYFRHLNSSKYRSDMAKMGKNENFTKLATIPTVIKAKYTTRKSALSFFSAFTHSSKNRGVKKNSALS
jgi:hypothetical protein